MMMNTFMTVTVFEALSSMKGGDEFSQYFFAEDDARENLQRSIERTFRPEKWTFAICSYDIECDKVKDMIDFDQNVTAEELMNAYRECCGEASTGWIDPDTYEEVAANA